jgi:hypothetical protein
VEQIEEQAVGSSSKGAEPCSGFLRAEYDPEGGEAVEVGMSGLYVVWAREQDMFLCVPVWAVWMRWGILGVRGVSIGAQGGVVCSLSEAVGIIGVK